jgi:hypothetical protein
VLGQRILLGVVLSAGCLFAQALTEASLPAPTGSLHIGRTEHHWIDESKIRNLGTTTGAKRELMVRVWYPAQDSTVPAFDIWNTSMPCRARWVSTLFERHSGVLIPWRRPEAKKNALHRTNLSNSTNERRLKTRAPCNRSRLV